MKTILSTTKDDEAQKQMTSFSTLGLVLSLASLFLFWWLAAAGIAASARGLILTWHKASTDVRKFRIMAIIGIVTGLVSFIMWLAQ